MLRSKLQKRKSNPFCTRKKRKSCNVTNKPKTMSLAATDHRTDKGSYYGPERQCPVELTADGRIASKRKLEDTLTYEFTDVHRSNETNSNSADVVESNSDDTRGVYSSIIPPPPKGGKGIKGS